MLYSEDPHPGIHSAVEWLLGRWGKNREIEAIDNASRSGEVKREVNWSRDGEGHSLAIVRGPIFFPLLTSTDFTKPMARKVIVPTRISYTYGIATKEVSVAQFRRFLSESRISMERLQRDFAGNRYIEQSTPDTRCPVDRVSFYAAAHYCNWLSEREGIPREQWCYEPLDDTPLGPVRPSLNYLKKASYRLPTYEEWMYALMGQAASLRYFGPTPETMTLFAWL